MSVGRICSREVDIARAGETVRRAASIMAQQQVGSLVVIDDDRKPVGLITDGDLVTRVLAAGKDPDLTKVEQAMTPDPVTISEDAPIESSIDLMRSGAFRHVPVVDGDGKLAGLVTLDDVLSLLCEEHAMIGQLLAQRASRTLEP
jgi:CBS domain-containing protein